MSGRYNLRRSTRVKRLKPQCPTGCPKDQIPRMKPKMDELDLHKSYAGIVKAPKRRKLPKKSRPWGKWKNDKPLTDPSKLPRGWHMNEDDLEVDDIEGQIQRCHERIAENIMPGIFRQRLSEYMASKAEEDQMRSSESDRFPGSRQLSMDVIRRIHELEGMKTDLEESLDISKQLPNIEALLEAYRSGQLDWNSGLVTYWSKGLQICQPRPFDWDEFELINSEHEGHEGFWTEGLHGPGPQSGYTTLTLGPAEFNAKQTGLTLALRIPGLGWFGELDFIHDTGCSMMTIYRNDLLTLMGPFAKPSAQIAPIIATSRTRSATGALTTKDVIEVEVTVLDAKRQRLTAWTRVPCTLKEGGWTASAVPRLDGPVLNDLLYSGTAPDLTRHHYFSNSKEDLFNVLPDLDLVANPPNPPIELYTKYMTRKASGTYAMPPDFLLPKEDPKDTKEPKGPKGPKPKAMPRPAPGTKG